MIHGDLREEIVRMGICYHARVMLQVQLARTPAKRAGRLDDAGCVRKHLKFLLRSERATRGLGEDEVPTSW